MSIYSVGNRTTNVTSANAALELIAGANDAVKLLEAGMSLSAATTSVYGLGTPGAKGITPTTPVTVLAEDAGNTQAGKAATALAWATGPTIPAAFFRRASLPATVGAGIIWTFPRGIVAIKNTSLVFWNLATNGALDNWVVVDE